MKPQGIVYTGEWTNPKGVPQDVYDALKLNAKPLYGFEPDMVSRPGATWKLVGVSIVPTDEDTGHLWCVDDESVGDTPS